jgi:hypothetical protein
MTSLYQCVTTLYLSLCKTAPHTITRVPTLLSQVPANNILKEHKYVYFIFNLKVSTQVVITGNNMINILKNFIFNTYIYTLFCDKYYHKKAGILSLSSYKKLIFIIEKFV